MSQLKGKAWICIMWNYIIRQYIRSLLEILLFQNPSKCRRARGGRTKLYILYRCMLVAMDNPPNFLRDKCLGEQYLINFQYQSLRIDLFLKETK
jgi:hypothetical protein